MLPKRLVLSTLVFALLHHSFFPLFYFPRKIQIITKAASPHPNAPIKTPQAAG